MFGEGISMLDLMKLLTAIREKDLVLQVKIINEEWENLSGPLIGRMIQAITSGKITQTSDIRLKLHTKT